MSYTQISLEKRKGINMWIAFIAVQFAILFLGVMVGLWIVALIRIAEVNTNSEVALVRIFAIVFTVLTAIATIVTIVSYILYIKYRNLLDGFVDQSLKNIQKEKSDVKNINIKLTTPVAQPATPVVNKTVQNGPVKKVVTTTTTTTSKPGTVVRTINGIPAKKGTETKQPISGLKSIFKKSDANKPIETKKVTPSKPVVKTTTTTKTVVGAKPGVTPKVAPVKPIVNSARPIVAGKPVVKTTTTKTTTVVGSKAPMTPKVGANPRPVMPLRPGVAPSARR